VKKGRRPGFGPFSGKIVLVRRRRIGRPFHTTPEEGGRGKREKGKARDDIIHNYFIVRSGERKNGFRKKGGRLCLIKGDFQ